ncbi:hypothetical protein NQ830_12540 [Clostridioides difficile]|uniref:hypothetical protein n=3 Tax=Clostridioides difficile TaxID=1496 RepID=UPI00038D8801|nr:hypothetical protein [Clostridioides difficile]EQJ88735.1 hypothetical protein QUC_3378 [Clostridioides difficile P50]MCE4884016.1 hypothetical protein [Clostridioides difficile]MCO8835311.1 hypothetical protein [Clostridioides difficile]MCP3278140.1 hypothetical protein [Clostridioides difficile]MCR1410161.1 hypothetical protein [Clostridioides difficile]
MKKILLFEGAGMDIYEEGSDVGNHRIRTAFINGNGDKIYLELEGNIQNCKISKRFGWYTHIDHCFNISMSTDENVSSIKLNNTFFNGYSKSDLTKYINKNFNCKFDTIEVLDWMEGYRVHGNRNEYNLMDDHELNRKRTIARNKAYEKIDKEIREKLGEKYSKISLYSMDEDSITIRCYTYEKDLYKIGMSEDNRLLKIPVNY